MAIIKGKSSRDKKALKKQRELMKRDCWDEGRLKPERERPQECLDRRRTGPQQYTTEEGAETRTNEI